MAAASANVDCDRYLVCGGPDEAKLAALPERLSQTGLFAVENPDAIAEGVVPFRPRYELWSDGAQKQRWVRLPPGARVDTSNVDDWVLPEGTQLWKEFRRDGVRVETRLLQKVGPGGGDWAALAYAWLPDGSDALAVPYGVEDALGTTHDVPGAGECHACHGGRKSYALGFSALQLAYDAEPGSLDLADLASAGLLTSPPAGPLDLPGNETERAALGYLHANCGHCHNQERPPSDGARCFDPDNKIDFWLRADALASPADTPTYRSMRETCVEPGDPDGSRLVQLVSRRGVFAQMPPLGTESVDSNAADLLRRWVAEMPR